MELSDHRTMRKQMIDEQLLTYSNQLNNFTVQTNE